MARDSGLIFAEQPRRRRWPLFVLAAGLVTLIAVQTVLNLCVVTNLLPSTGIALPFFSYGGTALAVNLGEMGIVLNISRSGNKRTIRRQLH